MEQNKKTVQPKLKRGQEQKKALALEPQKVIKEATKTIESEIRKGTQSFFIIGCELHRLRDLDFTGTSYSDVYDYACKNFQISRGTTSDWILTADSFCKRDEAGSLMPELESDYVEYNGSQLLEMRKLPDEVLKTVTPKTSVAELRKLKKQSKAKDSKVKKREENPVIDVECKDLSPILTLTAADFADFTDADTDTRKNAVLDFLSANLDFLVQTLADGMTLEIFTK